MQTEITANELREVLAYDEQTGFFTWNKKPSKRIDAGSRAGCLQKDTGYMVIKINGRLYKAHRLAWLMANGCWPIGVIDHINGVKSDNCLINIRDTTRAGNSHNQLRAHKRSKTGVLGVYKVGRCFIARIRNKGKLINLGRFDSAEHAHSAYVAAKRELHPTSVL